MALLAASALALEVEPDATGSAYTQVGNPFLGGPIVPVIPGEPSDGPTPSAARPLGWDWAWQPAAVVTASYPDLYVIAGTVLDLAALDFSDEDSHPPNPALTPDVHWDRTLTVSAGDVLETHYDPNGSTPTSSVSGIVWRAPNVCCDVTVGRTATDWPSPSEYAGTNDPLSLIDAQTIHVHRVVVKQLTGGLPWHQDQDETDPTWHCLDDGTWRDCDEWGNSATPVDPIKWTRTGGPNAPMLFDGQAQASVQVELEDPNGCSVTGLSIPIRVHAAWDDEGVELSGTTTITQLPQAGTVATLSAPIDAEVNWYDSVTWDWKCDVSAETRTTTDLPLGATQIPGVGTSHDGIQLSLSEATPKRVESVYSAMNAMSAELDIARAAAIWAALAGKNTDQSWVNDEGSGEPRRPLDDVWCIRCIGGGDCLSLALLGVRCARLAGLTADAGKGFPQKALADNWDQPRTCFASDYDAYWAAAGHPVRPLGFMTGWNWNRYEGCFSAAGKYWTCIPTHGEQQGDAPMGGWDSLAQMVMAIARHPGGDEVPEGLRAHGWACRHEGDGSVWPHGLRQGTDPVHWIPEP